MGIDGDLLKRYTMATWGYKQGEMVSLMIHLGVRLGLYQALDGAGPVTSGDLAATTGLHARWLREWLRAQGAAELLVTEEGETFEHSFGSLGGRAPRPEEQIKGDPRISNHRQGLTRRRPADRVRVGA